MNDILARAGIIAAALVAWFWTQKLIGSKPGGTRLIGDASHRITRKLHRYFHRNPQAANRALIASSLGIDVLGLSLVALSVFGRSFAPFLGMLIVFSLRQLSQLCCTLPPPPGIIWRHPGFPSLLVTYEVANDFFFSGHTALAVLAAWSVCQIAPWWLGLIVVLIALAEAAIVLILRAHYTMDVITGAIAACFAAHTAARLAPHLDSWLKG